MDFDGRLRFKRDDISDDNRTRLKDALSQNKTLKFVNFRESELTDSLVGALCEFIIQNKTNIGVCFGKSKFTEAGLLRLLDALATNKTISGINFDNSNLTDKVIDPLCRFIQQNRTIDWIGLGCSKFTDTGFSKLMGTLSRNKTLVGIDFCESELTDDAVDALSSLIRQNKKLEDIWFSNSKFTDIEFAKLMAVFSQNKTLVDIKFSSSKFTDKGLTNLSGALRENNTLSYINFCESELTDDAVDALSSLIRRNKKLEGIWFGNSKFTDTGLTKLLAALSQNTTLKNINFNRSSLTDRAVEALCLFLTRNKKLSHIGFSSSKFTDRGLTELMEALMENNTLSCINFRECELTNDAIDALSTLVLQNKKLDTIWFGKSKFTDTGFSKLMSGLSQNQTLVDIGFDCSSLTNGAVDALCLFLTRNYNLSQIGFPSSKFTDEGLSKLMQALGENHTLSSINFNRSSLTDDAVEALCSFLTRNYKLSQISFQKSKFTDEGLTELIGALRDNNILSCINFNQSALHDDEVHYLCTFLRQNKTLTTIKVLSSDFTVEDVCKMMPTLQDNNTLSRVNFDDGLSRDVLPPLLEFITRTGNLESLSCISKGQEHCVEIFKRGKSSPVYYAVKKTLLLGKPKLQKLSGKEFLKWYPKQSTSSADAQSIDGTSSVDGQSVADSGYDSESMSFTDSSSASGSIEFPGEQGYLSHGSQITTIHEEIDKDTIGPRIHLDTGYRVECINGIEFKYKEGLITEDSVQDIKMSLKKHCSLRFMSVDAPLDDSYVPALLNFIKPRRTVLEIRPLTRADRVCLEVMRRGQKYPMYYYAKTVREKMTFLQAAEYLREEIMDWLISESISSAVDLKSSKLVVFLTRESYLEQSLVEELKQKSLYTEFKHDYRVHPIRQPIVVLAEHGSKIVGSGSKVCYHDDEGPEMHYATCGAFLRDEMDRLYILTSCHGRFPKHCYLEQPTGRIRRKCKLRHQVYEKDSLIDATLLEVDSPDVDMLLHSPEVNSALCGMYTGPIEELCEPDDPAQSTDGTWVMKHGSTSEETVGILTMSDFHHPPQGIRGGILIKPGWPMKSFSEEGDSGSLIYRRSAHGHETIRGDYSLHEGIAVLCHGVQGLYKDSKCSLAFRLDEAVDHFESETDLKLSLVPFDHPEI